MKINYGSLKKRNLIIGDNKQMKPTQSITKSIIFNVLNINNKTKVLDVFAGTGAMGFESYSLGARKVFWFDNNFNSFVAIKKNIINFDINPIENKVFKIDFRIGLKNLSFKPNLIFLDPPFIFSGYYEEALSMIYNLNILDNNGIIVVEVPYKIEIPSLKNFHIKNKKRVGSKDILFLEIIK